MAPPWQAIQTMSEEELAEQFDAQAGNASAGIAFWGDMLVLRKNLQAAQALWEQAEESKALNTRVGDLTERIQKLTLWLVVLTVAVLVATVVAVVQ